MYLSPSMVGGVQRGQGKCRRHGRYTRISRVLETRVVQGRANVAFHRMMERGAVRMYVGVQIMGADDSRFVEIEDLSTTECCRNVNS